VQSFIFVQQMDSSPRYRFDFSYDAAFGHAVRMILRLKPSGLILDLGCGYAPLAEPLHQAGYDYVGIDSDPRALEDLRERGFESYPADLASLSQPRSPDLPMLVPFLGEVVAGRQVGAVLALDLIEHLADPTAFLSALRQALVELSRPLLILSVPNVAHYDLAAKLLLGRFDMTLTGLLDESHLRFFTYDRLRELTSALGWLEVDAEDVTTDLSDQHFPRDLPTLAKGTPLHELLVRLRQSCDPYCFTYQFVRAYALPLGIEEQPAPDPASAAGSSLPSLSSSRQESPELLSVVVLTTCADRRPLAATLQSICAQRRPSSWSSWTVEPIIAVVEGSDAVSDHRGHPALLAAAREVADELSRSSPLIAPPRVLGEQGERDGIVQPYSSRARALQAGLEAANGRLVVFVDDSLLLPPHFLEEVATYSNDHPGVLLRTGPGPDLLSMLAGEGAYLPTYVLPKQGIDSLGLGFDEHRFPYEDWLFLLEASLWLGVFELPASSAPTPHRIGRSGPGQCLATTLLGGITEDGDPERRVRVERAIGHLGNHPLVVPTGEVPLLAEIIFEAKRSRERIAELEAANRAVLSSTSWRITEPLRRLSGRLRALWRS